MSPSLSQNICVTIAFIGAILVAIGTFGNHYYGRKVLDEKDKRSSTNELNLNSKIESLIVGNMELNRNLEPFRDLAKSRFPNKDIHSALASLRQELARVDESTKKTVFKVVAIQRRPDAEGAWVQEFDLSPIGNNVIPILTLAIQTQNGAIIKEFTVSGPTIPGMSMDGSSSDGTAKKKEFRSLYPGKVHVKIVTDKDPGNIQMGIDPWDGTRPNEGQNNGV